MVLECCCNVVKCLLVVVNGIVTILGIALVTFGGMTFKFMNNIQFNPGASTIPSEETQQAAIIYYGIIGMMVVGILLILIGISGCCGALNENQCLLMTFALAVLLCLVACAGGVILLTQYKNSISSILTSNAKKLDDTSKNIIADSLSCCFNTTPSINVTCSEKSADYCGIKIANKVDKYADGITILLAITGIIQVLGFVSSVGLCCHIRKSGY